MTNDKNNIFTFFLLVSVLAEKRKHILMYLTKSSGPGTEPCGMIQVIR